MPRRTIVAVTPGNLDDRLLGMCQRASAPNPKFAQPRQESDCELRNRDTKFSPFPAKIIPKGRGGNYIEVISIRRRTSMSGLKMPAPDADVLKRRDRIVRALSRIVPGEGVIATAHEMKPYESDGLTAYRQVPMVVVLPETTEQVARVLRYCHQEGIKVVPRGAGTSLSGGALPLGDGVLLGMAKFNRIREIGFLNRVVVAESGVTNLAVSNAVAHTGFYYAPDPSSQIACTIGGNVAENSGGVHCLKYGMTTNNVLGCEIVLMSGEILRIGGRAAENSGYDLMGII